MLDTGRLNIGAYYLSLQASTPEHVRDLARCGIDVIVNMRNDCVALDLLAQNGVHAIVSGIVPGWFGGDGSNAGTMSEKNPLEKYEVAAERFEDHPAIIGIDMGDEPSSADFPYYGQVAALVRELLPDKFLYLNLYPSYGMLAANSEAQTRRELGVPSYREYLEAYCENVDLPYLSFDHYVYTSGADRLLSDLETAASFCKAYHKKLFVVLQVNSYEEDVFLSEEQLLFQAFSALAYGVSAVSWACYSAGWWHNQVLDSDGNKTPQYEKLKSVNQKLRFLATECIQYQWVATERMRGGSRTEFGDFRSVVSSQDALLGKFRNADGGEALFVSFPDDRDTENRSLLFRLEGGRQVCLHKSDGEKEILSDTDGVYSITLAAVDACFISVH